MYYQRTPILLAISITCCLSATLTAQTRVENWSDGDYTTGLLQWMVTAGNGQLTFGQDGLTMSSDGVSGPFFLEVVNRPKTKNFSLRTRMTPLSGARAGLGVSPERYFGAVQTDGTLRIGQSFTEVVSETSLLRFLDGRVIGSEFYLQWDAFGSELQAWAWPVGVVNPPVLTAKFETQQPIQENAPVLWASAGASSASFSEVIISDEHLPLPTFSPIQMRNIGGNSDYIETFDSLGNLRRPMLPAGWTGMSGEKGRAIFEAINRDFDPTKTITLSSAGIGDLYNAGLAGDSDRALATAVQATATSLIGSEIDLLAEIVDQPAHSLRLQFDIEAWNVLSRRVAPQGEGAFRVVAEINRGNGFETLVDLGKQSTGPILVPPARAGIVNGNLPENRTTVDLYAGNLDIPNKSLLRLRFLAADDISKDLTSGWVFGLDNVKVQMSPPVGDTTGDRKVMFDDFLILSSRFGGAGAWKDGDLDQDGRVEFADFLLLAAHFDAGAQNGAAAIPEPSGATWLLGLALIPNLLRRTRREHQAGMPGDRCDIG